MYIQAKMYFGMPQDHQGDVMVGHVGIGTHWEPHNHLWGQSANKRRTLENCSPILTELSSLNAQSYGLCIVDVSQPSWS